ncbi:MAG: IPT/TIG domain-containing protein, partial [Candidatus Obscuribacterales bacterium]|nr:IPT/TIG domain-containing protein [Candidatus Obscuribacterales bacterium]
MTEIKLLISLFVLLTFIVCSPEFAYANYAQVEDIATGGPYRANNRLIQRFSGKFSLSQTDVKRHMVLVLHNGFSDSPGYTWLRIFLCGDIDTSSLGAHEEPIGDLLLDENPVQRHVIRIDLTDLVSSGTNTIVIEGKGQKDALLTWSLEGAVEPQIAQLNPRKTRGGARLTLYGSGFSTDPDENQATFNGKPGKVVASSRSTMTIEVPNTLKEGQADLEITTNGLKSAPYLINVEPLPEVFSI